MSLPESDSPDIRCAACGALLAAAGDSCPACAAKFFLPDAAAPAGPSPVQPPAVQSPDPDEFGEVSAEEDDRVAVPMLAGGILFLIVGVGLWNVGLAIFVALATLPALVRTALLRYWRKKGGGGLTARQSLGHFVLSTAITLGVIGLVFTTAIVAAIVGLCCLCIPGANENVVVPITLSAMGILVVVELGVLGWLAWHRFRGDLSRGRARGDFETGD